MKYAAIAVGIALVLGANIAGAQTFKVLAQFTGNSGPANGAHPQYNNLTLSGTTLYGMTPAAGNGNIFSVGYDGTNFNNLLSFAPGTGNRPSGSVLVSGNSLYGMTYGGGIQLEGNLFSINSNGTNFQNLVSFSTTPVAGTRPGLYPMGSLTPSGTTFYGMTSGAGSGTFFGNVFSVAPDGSNFLNLLSFSGTGGARRSGADPHGSLTLGGTTLYGMTYGGGSLGFGNVFSVGTDGTSYSNIVSFSGTSGAATGAKPQGSLILVGTALYGMTYSGGTTGLGNIFSVGTDGTGYQSLLSFTGTGLANGSHPEGSLTLSGTTLYGMTSNGGPYHNGNIFGIGIDGSGYTDLYDFTLGDDGGVPGGDLTLSGGTLFGMTSNGGAYGYGTVFALTVPEPGTLALVGGGAAMMGAYRWRRRRQTAKSE